MARERLTKRMAVNKADGIFPGDVGNEEREYKDVEEYHTFEHTVNHELPDMRTDWKENPRDDIGFGIPKKAALHKLAYNATKLAYCLLGDKATEGLIETQAREFMRMGSKRIQSTLQRFADTDELYNEEEEVVTADQNEGNAPSIVPEGVANDVEAPKVTTEVANDVAIATEEPANNVEPIQEVTPETQALQKVAEEVDDIIEEELDEDVNEIDETLEGCNTAEDNMEIELSDEILDEGVEADAELEGLFAGDDFEKSNSVEVASVTQKEKGIQSLGGQPKVASKREDEDISNLWGDTPDVSHVFNV